LTIAREAASCSDDAGTITLSRKTRDRLVEEEDDRAGGSGGMTMVARMTLEELSGRFAVNEQRRRLFDLLVDELASIQTQCRSLRVLVFGSYISDKDSPHDIDILISLIPNEECVYALWTGGLRREHPDEVDVHYYKTQRYIKDAEGLLEHFNSNPKNELQGIAIRDAVEITGI